MQGGCSVGDWSYWAQLGAEQGSLSAVPSHSTREPQSKTNETESNEYVCILYYFSQLCKLKYIWPSNKYFSISITFMYV